MRGVFFLATGGTIKLPKTVIFIFQNYSKQNVLKNSLSQTKTFAEEKKNFWSRKKKTNGHEKKIDHTYL